MIKECIHHGPTEFGNFGNRWRCKRCNVDRVNKRRRTLKLKAIEYMGGKCSRCGYNKCVDALEFHHLDPSEKDFGIGTKGYTRSWDRVKEELDKCIMLCSNCHREEHST